MMKDYPAQICWQYLHGGFDENINEAIYTIVHSAIPDQESALHMIYDIAYRIGHANSALCNLMSEATYKSKKKWVRDTLMSELCERNKNEQRKA
jgi:hypothetical protein